ncbi:MAG: hypothetical protein QMD71_03155 [bacterium]|nr:hypothetical protein [bacterium]
MLGGCIIGLLPAIAVYVIDEKTHTGEIRMGATCMIDDQKVFVTFHQVRENLEEKEGLKFFTRKLIVEIIQ